MYENVTAEDPDVRKFVELSNNFQMDIYQGLGGAIQDLAHRWVARRTPEGRVLEIGFGAGRHALYFSRRLEDYFASEYSAAHAGSPMWARMRGRLVRCDARCLPYANGAFDAVISIYNLEHIADLQPVFSEVHRVLKPSGRFLVGLPCEGGLMWNVGRELTSRRMFQKKYGINYDKVIAFEHVWDLTGILRELGKSGLFRMSATAYFPFFVPSANLNLIACLDCGRK